MRNGVRVLILLQLVSCIFSAISTGSDQSFSGSDLDRIHQALQTSQTKTPILADTSNSESDLDRIRQSLQESQPQSSSTGSESKFEEIKFQGIYSNEETLNGIKTCYIEPFGPGTPTDKLMGIEVCEEFDPTGQCGSYELLAKGDLVDVYSKIIKGNENEAISHASIKGNTNYYIKKVKGRPDIKVLDIKFTKDNPVAGEPIDVIATIKNIGEAEATITSVTLYQNSYYLEPIRGGLQLPVTIVEPNMIIKKGDSQDVILHWNAVPIYNISGDQISVNALCYPSESNTENNERRASIYVDKNIKSCLYDVSKHGYSFKNYGTTNEDLDLSKDWRNLENIHKHVAGQLFNIAGLPSPTEGHCFGMASTCILYYKYNKLIPIRKEFTFKLLQDDPDVESNIMVYHNKQYRFLLDYFIINFVEAGINLLGGGPTLNVEFGKIKDSLGDNEPVMLSMWGSGSAHSVVAYDYYENPNDAKIKYIVIDDSRYPGMSRVVKFDLRSNLLDYEDFEKAKVEEPISFSQITDIIWPTKDAYDHTDLIPVDVDFTNWGSQPYSFWIGFSVQDSTGEWWDAPAQQTATIQPGKSASIQIQWQPPETAPEGAYNAKVALWDDKNYATDLMVGEFDSRTKDNAFQLNPIQVRSVLRSEGSGGWDKIFKNGGDNEGNSVQQTKDGGYIVAGSTQLNKFFDVWLIKTDVNGNKLWDKTFGGSESDWGNSVQQTKDGGYIVAGTKSYGDDTDVWLIKTDANGNKLWDKTFGGSKLDGGYSVQQTKDGGYIITGWTGADHSVSGVIGRKVWLIKTDANGHSLWDKIFSELGDDCGNSVQQTTDGGYIVTGRTGEHEYEDLWLIKTDPEGNKTWDRTFGGSGDDCGNSVQQTNDGGYIITGEITGIKIGESDYAWLIKTDADGNKLWGRKFGGSYQDRGNSVQQTNDGGYIITGMSNGDKDLWMIKTDADGNELWDRKMRYCDDCYNDGKSVQQTTDGGYIVVGETKMIGAQGSVIWLIKTDAEGNVTKY